MSCTRKGSRGLITCRRKSFVGLFMYASLAMSRTSFHQHWYEDASFFAFYSQTSETVTVPVVNLCFRVGSRTWHDVAFCFIFPQVFGLKIKTNSNQHVGKWFLYQQTHPSFHHRFIYCCFYILEPYQWKFPFLLQKRICHLVSKDKKALVLASNVIFLAPKRHNLATPKAYREKTKSTFDIRSGRNHWR